MTTPAGWLPAPAAQPAIGGIQHFIGGKADEQHGATICERRGKVQAVIAGSGTR